VCPPGADCRAGRGEAGRSSSVVPGVSVVMATFNGRRFVEAQITSLFSQEVPPIEIVIGDDGSTDGTVEMIRELAGGAPLPVRIIERTGRLGYAANFLDTARHSRGELVAFCDQDDVWYSEKIRRVVAEFSDPDVTLVAHHADVIDEAGRPLRRTFPAQRHHGRFGIDLPLAVYPGFALTVRRELLELADPTLRPGGEGPGGLSHDVWMWLLAPCAGSTVILPECLAAYRQHPGNAVGERHVSVIERASGGSGERFAAAASYNEELSTYLTGLARCWEAHGWHVRAARARASAERYRRYARRLYARADLYEESSLRSALGQWTSMLGGGCYSGRGLDGAGMPAALKDLARVVVAQLRSYGVQGDDEGTPRMPGAAAHRRGPQRDAEARGTSRTRR